MLNYSNTSCLTLKHDSNRCLNLKEGGPVEPFIIFLFLDLQDFFKAGNGAKIEPLFNSWVGDSMVIVWAMGRSSAISSWSLQVRQTLDPGGFSEWHLGQMLITVLFP